MNKIPDIDIWTKRKNALRKFVIKENYVVKEKIDKRERDLALKKAAVIEEEFILDSVYDNNKKLPRFLHKYEQRQRRVCDKLLEHLLQFTDYAATFLEGSGDNIGFYSRRHLWRMLLNKASTDLLRFQAAVQQRSPAEEIQPYGEVFRNTLIKADIIAEHALDQAVENEFLDQTPIFTFLKEKISIREVPYANVPMIGLAFASIGEPDEESISFLKVSPDMLAIPHEVGHHLYWKGRITKDGPSVSSYLKEQLKQAKIWEWDWRNNWLEEIFADAYGFLVAGPVMALSFQELLTDDPPANFKVDNGRHPIPALRPFIQTKILRAITNANGDPLYTEAPEKLDDEWKTKIGADPLKEDYELYGALNLVKGQQILDGLDEIIKIILQTLRGQVPTDADASWTHGDWKPWTEDVQEGEDPFVLCDRLTFQNIFSFKNHWLQYQVASIPVSQEDLPEQISSGWKEKEPEDHGG